VRTFRSFRRLGQNKKARWMIELSGYRRALLKSQRLKELEPMATILKSTRV